jgi:O-antigen ligase
MQWRSSVIGESDVEAKPGMETAASPQGPGMDTIRQEPGIAVPRFGALEAGMSTVRAFQQAGLVLVTFLCTFPSWFHVEEYIFFSLLVLTVGAAWIGGTRVWVRTPVDAPLLLLVAWILLTIPFATDPAYSFGEWRKLVAQALVFYWTLFVLRLDARRTVTRCVLVAVVVGTAFISVHALVDFVDRGGSWRDRDIRAAAPSSDYNWLSTYMVMAIPILIATAAVLHRGWERVACILGVGLAVLAQVISYTRAGWLGMAAQGCAAAALIGRRRAVIWFAMGCAVVVVGLVALSQLGYQQGTVDPLTLHLRLGVWKLGLGDVAEHPIVGVGYGNMTFIMRYSGYPETTFVPGLHNAFLVFATGSGIPALLLLLSIFWIAVRVLVRVRASSPDREAGVVALAVAIMIVGFAVRNVFDYMFAGSLAYLFWILLATGLTQASVSVGNSQNKCHQSLE